LSLYCTLLWYKRYGASLFTVSTAMKSAVCGHNFFLFWPQLQISLWSVSPGTWCP
jgi:hypothetical protein